MILGTYLKKLRLRRRSKNNSNPSFPQIPTIHLTLPTPYTEGAQSSTVSDKMAFSRTASSSTTEYTNGYHTPTSPPAYTDHSVHSHHGHDHDSSASRQEYARILYEHTMKQMERFAQDAQSRGTLSMDHYPYQQRAAAIN
ncbi:hypothetical protein TWF970_002592 [Orbilia oligospora]|uniref:Uncharacterized protein n=1 Tax=Orbilia oligospora TaxID=2813651 RepID=A0A7C8VGH8_ORBOL|nr:hypothetical protein TWF970_002592 [Orbilia oligospora]